MATVEKHAGKFGVLGRLEHEHAIGHIFPGNHFGSQWGKYLQPGNRFLAHASDSFRVRKVPHMGYSSVPETTTIQKPFRILHDPFHESEQFSGKLRAMVEHGK